MPKADSNSIDNPTTLPAGESLPAHLPDTEAPEKSLQRLPGVTDATRRGLLTVLAAGVVTATRQEQGDGSGMNSIAKATNGLFEPKHPRISAKMRQLIDLLAKGTVATQKAAAERVGLSEEHVSRMLARPQVQALLAHEARKILAKGQLRAAARVVELIDSESAHASLNASELTLRINGIVPAEAGGAPLVSLSVQQQPGYIIQLNLGDAAGPDVDATTQFEVAGVGSVRRGPLIEHDDGESGR
jgi:hypothetical protein